MELLVVAGITTIGSMICKAVNEEEMAKTLEIGGTAIVGALAIKYCLYLIIKVKEVI